MAQVVVTRKCNLRCAYCNEFDNRTEMPTTEALLRRIDRLVDLGALAIEYTGGEPLLHRDIFRLIEYGTRRNLIERRLITNAFLLDPGKVRALNKAGLSHMQVSIDGVYPTDVTIKVLERLKPALYLLRDEAWFKVTVSAVVGAAPRNEMLEVMDFAKECGFCRRILLRHDERGQVLLSRGEREDYREIQSRLTRRWWEPRDYKKRLLDGKPAPFHCRAGSRYLYIDVTGKAHWCSQTRDLFGKRLDDYTFADLKRQFYTRKPCTTFCTLGCARIASMLDEWRGQDLTHENILPPRPEIPQ